MAATEFAGASVVENVRFNQAIIVPNALQGLFRRRPGRVAVATRLDVDGQGVRLLAGLRRKHGPKPLRVRVVKDPALLLLDVPDVRRALEGSPHPFAADPEAKKRGMGHFQPDALTLSRGALWEDRRRFTEAVLDVPTDLRERFTAVVREEVTAVLDGADALDHDLLHRAYRRITRRVVLGDEAREDEGLSRQLAELMEEANSLPSEPSPQLRPFVNRLEVHLARASAGSLAERAAQAPSTPDTKAAGQLPHWIFATQDTLSANVLRALALALTQPGGRDDLAATLQEAMRLWPTTPLLSRETLADVTWHGVRVPAGTNVLIPNVFHHRDPERLGDSADRFTPEGWGTDGAFTDDWGLNHLSHGPQGCPGGGLAVRLGTATLATLLDLATPELEQPGRLDPARPLPHMLDVFALRFSLR